MRSRDSKLESEKIIRGVHEATLLLLLLPLLRPWQWHLVSLRKVRTVFLFLSFVASLPLTHGWTLIGMEQLMSKSLTDLVRGVRGFKNKGGEHAWIQSQIQVIRKEVHSPTKEVKVGAVLKLAYLQMLGYEIGWAAPDVIEVMSFPKFAHKRIGYLAASFTFNQHTDVLIMSTNLFRKDVTSSNQYEAGIALTALANVATPDLARDLAPDIVSLLSHSKPYVKKKAIMVLYHIFVEFPDALRPAFPKLKEKLKDSDLSTVAAAVSVLCELARKNPANYVKLAPTLFNLLTQNAPHAWLQLKLVKLFALLCPVEPRLPKRLVEPLTNIINTTPVMSLLYECINTCTTGLVKHLPIIRLCIQKLRVFIESTDQNHKYLGLLALGNIMEVHPKAVREHKDTVLICLEDGDESIRLRALDLLVGMVDKKNLADIVERLMTHLDSADGHYKSQLVCKIVAIASQRDFRYITDFEWYIGVLVRLTQVQGNEQGKLISDQLLDVAVRVEVVRRFAVKQMILLLQEQRFFVSQSKIVDALYAAAWITGEFSTSKDAVTLLSALLNAQIRSIPGNVQAACIQAALKVFSRIAGAASAGASGNSNLLSLDESSADGVGSAVVDEKAVAALDSCLALLDKQLPPFAESEVAEVQERACFTQQVLRVYRSVGNASVALEIASLFAQPLNPVHPDAQSVVPIPEGLDLEAQIVEWPVLETEESMDNDAFNDEYEITSGFGGYQHPGSLSVAKGSSPATSGGPVDKRYYLGAGAAPGGVQVHVPETEALDLKGMKIVVRKEPRKKQGKKHVKAKITTELALPSGVAPSRRSGNTPTPAGKADALGAINLDDDLSESEKQMLEHKTYAAMTVATPLLKKESPAESESGGKKKRKGGRKRASSKPSISSVGASNSSAVGGPVKSDPLGPQAMCGATDQLGAICRVVVDPSKPKQLAVQIAVQNRSSSPWIHASFDLKPSSVFKLVSRSLPNPFAVAANSVAPLLCAFELSKPLLAPLLVEGSFKIGPDAPAIAASFKVHPVLFVAPQKISLDDLGRKIAVMAPQLCSASTQLTATDQKAALKHVSDSLHVKKVRIDHGAALFYGAMADGTDIFVHIKQLSETTMMLEIKTVHKELSKALAEYGASI